MAKTRSPNYPVMSLAETLESARPVFRAENRNKMSRMVLAGHMGYRSLNGRALGRIGALRAYGLIEGTGDELRMSEDAITALSAPSGSPEQKAAMERCALKPVLFSELRNDFPDTHPSLENLKFSLIRRRFTEEAAAKAAQNYLDTMSVVGENEATLTDRPANSGDSRAMQTEGLETSRRSAAVMAKGVERAEFPLPEGVVRFEFPSGISMDSYDEIEAWFSLVLRRLKRTVAPQG